MLVFQGGFLEDPSKPGTSGQRDLQYDIENGTFKLKTLSFARINCDMDFDVDRDIDSDIDSDSFPYT